MIPARYLILNSLSILALSLVLGAGFGAEGATCGELLGEFSVRQDGAIVYNPQAGGARAQAYPLEFTLANLGLTERDFPALGPKVLLIGEGYGTLFPALNQVPGLEVHAADPIYGMNPIPKGFMGDLLRDFMNRFQATGRLHVVSSHQTGFADNEADSVIGHMVLNNFIDAEKKWAPLSWTTVNEAIRVVRPGGRILFSSLNKPEELEQLVKLAQKEFPGMWKNVKFFVRSRVVDIRYDDFGVYAVDKHGVENKSKTISTLIITKY